MRAIRRAVALGGSFLRVNQFDTCMGQGFDKLLEVAGEPRELIYLNSSGATVTSNVQVIWSIETMRQEPIADVGSGNVYYKGDVLMSIRKSDFDALPRPDLSLQSPSGYFFHIADVIYDYEVWFLTLVRHH